ncbi:MAG: SurA N-terminal domain-containing protein, partial [Salinivirgaceae bacterium]|nr:SurA N-terminal domain-containing protein [Salinivirgaceae bacterium]
MATLQKIRDHAGTLVTIIVALALLAFIVGDLFKADGTFGSSRNNIGSIAGTDIPIQYYQAKVDENTEIYKQNTQQNSLESAVYDQIQDQTWEQLIRQYVIEEEYAKAGINVTADELFDMVQGNFVDPQVMQIPIFRDAETGQFDRNLVIQFLKNKDLDPSGQAASSWAAFEKGLVQNKKDQKFLSLVGMGMYATSLQAEKESNDKNTKYDFDYVQLRYSSVADSLVKVTDGDLKNYYSNHKKDFEQEESRDIYYVTFPIVASEDDHKNTVKSVEDLKNEFASKDEDAIEQFVNLESEIAFNGKYLAKEDLSEPVAE